MQNNMQFFFINVENFVKIDKFFNYETIILTSKIFFLFIMHAMRRVLTSYIPQKGFTL